MLYLLRQLFDPASDAIAVAACGSAAPPRAEGGRQRVVNHRLGFSLVVPSNWELAVEQRYDGPLRLFGFTLIPRILRPGTPRSYRGDEEAGWNCLTLRGGTAAGLDISVCRRRPLPTPANVMNDKWARVLNLRACHMEENVSINDLAGFAVVRNLPGGSELTGFGAIAEPVVMRQWWLQGDGLSVEIRGVAPRQCSALQDAMDEVVASIVATPG
ncbi:hypothetical protein [Kineobactrum salinum]|uniref:Uncharacterized protein n=1 Tax=Kineobactrum salinum TaxID=2708301 RepID=A0A6C0U5P6_9GAMM|nr:hypothetical protein [Kineobactrum salinum]QIB67258.1 hypothetical protein G3T16_19485 [Kineobactrum salinum]